MGGDAVLYNWMCKVIATHIDIRAVFGLKWSRSII